MKNALLTRRPNGKMARSSSAAAGDMITGDKMGGDPGGGRDQNKLSGASLKSRGIIICLWQMSGNDTLGGMWTTQTYEKKARIDRVRQFF